VYARVWCVMCELLHLTCIRIMHCERDIILSQWTALHGKKKQGEKEREYNYT